MKIDQIRATGRATREQEPPRPLRPATDLPRRAAPHRGSSDSELAPETPAVAMTLLRAGRSLWPPAPGDSERLQNRLLFLRSGGEGCPSPPIYGAQRGTPAPHTSKKLAGTHLPTHSPRSPGRRGAGRWHQRQEPVLPGAAPRGTGRIWSLPFSAQMSSELPRGFLETKTGCFQAASRPHRVTRPELAGPPPSPALLRVLPSGHCLLIDAWKQTQRGHVRAAGLGRRS